MQLVGSHIAYVLRFDVLQTVTFLIKWTYRGAIVPLVPIIHERGSSEDQGEHLEKIRYSVIFHFGLFAELVGNPIRKRRDLALRPCISSRNLMHLHKGQNRPNRVLG